MFERLQFRNADEQVVLLVAHGTGPCAPFCIYHVEGADDLADLHPLDPVGATPAAEGKWSDLVLSLTKSGYSSILQPIETASTDMDGRGNPIIMLRK